MKRCTFLFALIAILFSQSVIQAADVTLNIKFDGEEIKLTDAEWAAGVELHPKALKSGSIYLAPEGDELVLRDAVIESSTDVGLSVVKSSDAYNIKNITLEGKNTITANGVNDAMQVKTGGRFFVYGQDGILELISENGNGLYIGDNTTFYNDTHHGDGYLKVVGGKYGVCGNTGSEQETFINSGFLSATGAEGSIVKLYLFYGVVVKPRNALFDGHEVLDEGTYETITSEVIAVNEVENYSLFIDGVVVNSYDASHAEEAFANIIESGTMTIGADDDGYTITLKDAAINGSKAFTPVFQVNGKKLHIVLEGDNTINTAAYSSAIQLTGTDAQLLITGKGTLTINSLEQSAIWLGGDNAIMTVDHTNLTINVGDNPGIEGYTGINGGQLEIIKSTLTIVGNETAVSDLKSITLTNCEMSEADNAIIYKVSEYTTRIAYAKKTDIAVPQVHITPVPVLLGFSIDGVKVTDDYIDQINAGEIDGISGEITILTGTDKGNYIFKNVSLKSVVFDTETTIYFEGTNIIESTDGVAAFATTDYTQDILFNMSEYASLELNANGNTGIKLGKDTELDILNGGKITINAAQGIVGAANISSKVSIEGTKMVFNTIDKPVSNLSVFNLSGVEISKPVGAEYSTSERAIVLDGEIYLGALTIEEYQKYGIFINGEELNSVNIKDIKLASGSFTYNAYSNVLSLKDATIEGENPLKIATKSLLTVILEGNNTLRATNKALDINSYVNFEGDGTLSIESDYIGISSNPTTEITFDGITVNIKALYGISYAKLKLKFSILTIDASIRAADYLDLEMIGCKVQGDEVSYNPLKESFVNKDEIGDYAKQVEIGLVLDYITINNLPVTLENADNIVPEGLADGKISYDYKSNTLTLDGVELNGHKGIEITDMVKPLSIMLVGKNKINTSLYGLRVINTTKYISYVTAAGTGKLIIDAEETAAIKIDKKCTLVLGYAYYWLSGETAIEGFDGTSGETVQIWGGQTHLDARKKPISDVQDFMMTQVDIVSPAFSEWSSEKKALVKSVTVGDETIEEIITNEVVSIRPDATITVGSILIDMNNCDDVQPEGLKKGKISYDYTTATLTLDNVELEADVAGISFDYTSVNRTTIQLIGENRIIADGTENALALNANTLYTIKGDGSLYLEGGNGLYVNSDSDLELYINAPLTAYGYKNGIIGTGNVNINSTVKAQGDISSIELPNLQIHNLEIVSPANVYFDEKTGNIMRGSEVVTEEVVLHPTNTVTIGTITLKASDDDVSSPQLESGTISWDANAHILTLTDAKLNGGISTNHDDITIVLNGENMISNDISHSGTGTLTITGNTGGELEILGHNGTAINTLGRLVVERTKINMPGVPYGIIVRTDNYQRAIIIKDAWLSINAYFAAIMAYSDVRLVLQEGSQIVRPEDATWGSLRYGTDAYYWGLLNSSSTDFALSVLIRTKWTVGLDEVEASENISNKGIEGLLVMGNMIEVENTNGEVAVYDVLGHRVETALAPCTINLPSAGIFILKQANQAAKVMTR